MRHISCLYLLISLLLLCGCNDKNLSIEEREERDPLVKTGQAYMEKGEYNKAIESFKQALENNPRMARPHLDLATIYQQHVVNYIHAIYHYDRYLELRPESQKAEFINGQRQRVAKALSNTFINHSEEVKKVVSELKRLQQENSNLKKRLAGDTPTTTPKTISSKPSVTRSVPKTTKPDKPQSGKHQIYHVVQGDNLSKIATRFYGDSSQWDAIYEANKDRMKSASDLRVGQTLVIPALAN